MCEHREWMQHTGYRRSDSSWQCTECGATMANGEFIIYCEIKKLRDNPKPDQEAER